jgi:succinate dehydrogenase / fumarate reductase, membrane anchor subunit
VVKRAPVGAHYGLRDWLAQRVTATVMALYTLLLLIVLLAHRPSGFDEWHGMFEAQWFKLASLLFLLSVFWHAWVGVRDILMDYVKPTGVRLVAQVAVILALFAYAAWSAQILWSV